MPESVPNPFAHPAAVDAARRHARRTVVAAAKGARWVFSTGRIAPGLAVAQTPAVPTYESNGNPVLPEGLTTEDAAAVMLDLLDQAAAAAGSTVVVARNLAASGTAWDALQALHAARRIRIHPLIDWKRAVLDRADAPDAETYLRQALSPSRLKRIRQKRRALGGEAGLRLVITELPGEMTLAIDGFVALERAGWKGKAGTALAQDSAAERYVRAVLCAMAATGDAFVLRLMRADAIVAAALLVKAEGEVVFWKTAYDETLSRHSPGVVLDVMVTEWLLAQPWFRTLDAAHDDSVSPTREIWSGRRPTATVVIDLKPGSVKGGIVAALLRARQRLRAWKNRRAA
jgi:CelD/BcsL family acetyltransferase involved in cellulose biosynthesis